MKEDQGFFESLLSGLGRSVDSSFEHGIDRVHDGVSKIRSIGRTVKIESAEDVLGLFLQGVANKEIEVKPIGKTDNYSTILSWVKANRKGNKFFMLKGKWQTSTIIAIFFGENDEIFLDNGDPKVCFVCDDIPQDIQDLFGEKQMYVQHFK